MPQILPLFIFENIPYGPIIMRDKSFSSYQWPNTSSLVVKIKYDIISSKFGAIVDGRDDKITVGFAKRQLIKALNGFDCSAVQEMIDKLSNDDKFECLGGNYKVLFNLAHEMRKHTFILCKFSGCDGWGRECFRQFVTDNLGDRTIIELNCFP